MNQHTFNHIDLVQTYGIGIEHLKVSAQNLFLSDHDLLIFEYLLIDYKPKFPSYWCRCISEDTIANLKEIIPPAVISVPHPKITEESYLKFSPSQLDHLSVFTACSLRASLDYIAPVKKKRKSVKRQAPWKNLNTCKLKQKTHKLEKKWRSTKVKESHMAWQDSLIG